MSRAAGLCGRCGGPKRGRSARASDPVADCSRCGTPICKRHARWDSDEEAWVCTRCARTEHIRVVK
jgi:hypothetical protein